MQQSTKEKYRTSLTQASDTSDLNHHVCRRKQNHHWRLHH